MRVILEATGRDEEVDLGELWEAIEAVASRAELQGAVATVTDLVPPSGVDDQEGMRAGLAARIAMVSGFPKTLTEVIDFEATPRPPGCWRL